MPWTPAGPCSSPRCPNLRPCPDHPPPAPWSTSHRRRPPGLSGSGEQRRAERVIARARTVCHICGHPGADEADHIKPLGEGGADDETNMAPAHGRPCSTCGRRCHREKTSEEAARARARRRVG